MNPLAKLPCHCAANRLNLMKTHLRQLGCTIVSATFVLLCLLLPSPIRGAGGPNIILCMGDDHGWKETGYNGHPYLHTPVLDEMAARGLRLDRFYAAHPSCCPTRGSVLTGRHPNRYGTFTANCSIRPEEITIAHLLGGIKTRNFRNFRHAEIPPDDFSGPRVILDNDYKLVIHDRDENGSRAELFQLRDDPAEEHNRVQGRRAVAQQMKRQLREWQKLVLNSLTGADYGPD